jgi:glycosyltransferase involved in cell wall biosynthesis
MRICYLTDGRYIHSYRWLRYFSERGHDMYLLSYAPMDAQHVAAVEKAGGKYHGMLGPFHLKRFWRTASDLWRLLRLLRRERIDVLHCHFLGVNAWYAVLSRFHPLVLTVMGGDICGPDWQPRDDIRERWLTPFALRNADLITCWSHQLTGVVRRYARPGTPVEVIHGGVDLRRFSPGPKPQHLRERWGIPPYAKVVFSPRLMMPLYNLDKIAEAANEVCAILPDTYFLFAVLPNPKDEGYETRVGAIAAAGLATDRVRFIGEIPHDEMADYYRLADVTVSIPSNDGTPMSVLESMACGTPVLVSDIPDYDPHYIEPEKTVLAARPDDAAAVARVLLCLLQEPTRAAQLAGEARRRVETTGGYEAQMSHMEQLYRALFKTESDSAPSI